MLIGNSLTNSNPNNSPKKTTTDRSTNSQTPPTPQRIVCITPLGTELLYALDCENKIVGVDIYSDYPPEVKLKPSVGSFFDTNFEAITALKPDLIVILGQGSKISEFCEQHNIRILKLTMSDLASIYEDILLTGKNLDCPEKAKKLCSNIFNDLNSVTSSLINSSSEQIAKKKVFLCLSRKPGTISNLGTTGPDTCLDELISIAGGINIFNDLTRPYADISRESLIARNPDIIIEAVSKDAIDNSYEKMIEQWKLLDVDATNNNRIYFIDENIINRPGVRSADIAKQLYRLIQQQ